MTNEESITRIKELLKKEDSTIQFAKNGLGGKKTELLLKIVKIIEETE